MTDGEPSKVKLETWLLVGFIVALLLSTTVIVVTSADKDTVYSAYVTDADTNLQYQQISTMRASLGDEGKNYVVANTMSTPMLVNDWREPHRTMLVIAAPEKPFDSSEAEAIHDFVTEKGGKVIIAANSTNAQTVAEEFDVKFFDAPVVDPNRYYEVKSQTGQPEPADQHKIWAVAGVSKVWDDQFERREYCSDLQDSSKYDDCALPVLFHRPTAIQVLENDVEDSRNVKILAHASGSAFIAREDNNPNNRNNPVLGGNNTGLIVRMDYPGIEVIDQVKGIREGEVDVTGSIVFISDHSVFANHLWDKADADVTGKEQCSSASYGDRACWDSLLSSSDGDTTWNGNEDYFVTMIRDMMEHDNEEISTVITSENSNFYIVFDESRHVTSAVSSPFTEAIGAIVMLTSDTLLKWLIILNLVALLSIAIMVVPEKENWRHIFDLTRFRERPNKVDPNQYIPRVREALMAKVRQFNDLTRDEMIRKTPGEVQSMVKDPRLIELLYSQQRSYSNEELRQLLQQIRRWGK